MQIVLGGLVEESYVSSMNNLLCIDTSNENVHEVALNCIVYMSWMDQMYFWTSIHGPTIK